ncbi:nuclear transcription factor Y subunit gamma [Anopheles marshallii]|uniref:nuclear transcription factor Y subunit gamma n=1 Tax=Anopheles marshallii TaxID=1521116 RepID=UPI00237B2F4A|nr:nuclear transcription factor Y subunit gamma [Anopheles marshallii]
MDTPKKPLVVAASATITKPLAVVTTTASNTITSGAESGSAGGKEKLTDSQRNIQKFWPNVLREIQLVDNVEPGNQLLPLARIKKIMKLDEEVKMISSDAPLLFAKAIEIFIQELTLRAWLHTEHNKRRTLQRSDIAMAITKYDQFDFLIDIVPRDEIKVYKKEFEGKSEDGPSGGTTVANSAGNSNSTNGSEDMQYFFQLSQQHQKVTLQHATKGSIGALANGSTVFDLATVIGAAGSQQLLQAATASTMATAQQDRLPTGGESQAGVSTPVSTFQQLPSSQTTIQTASGQSIILANGSATAGGVPNGSTTTTNQLVSANQSLQLLQHVMTPTGEITQIPLNFIRTAGTSGTPNTGQPIFIQTAPMQAGPTIIHTGPTGVFLSANQLQQLQQQQAQQQHQQNHHHQTQHQHQSQLQNNHQQQRD